MLRLTDDDDPASLSPCERTAVVLREGLAVGEQPAVFTSVDPPHYFGAAVDRDHLGPDTVIDHRPGGAAKRRRQPHRAPQTGH